MTPLVLPYKEIFLSFKCERTHGLRETVKEVFTLVNFCDQGQAELGHSLLVFNHLSLTACK